MRKFQVTEIQKDVSTAKYVYYVPQTVFQVEGNNEGPQNVEKIGCLSDADQADMRSPRLVRGLGVVIVVVQMMKMVNCIEQLLGHMLKGCSLRQKASEKGQSNI